MPCTEAAQVARQEQPAGTAGLVSGRAAPGVSYSVHPLLCFTEGRSSGELGYQRARDMAGTAVQS
jgi:hypothetical protein